MIFIKVPIKLVLAEIFRMVRKFRQKKFNKHGKQKKMPLFRDSHEKKTSFSKFQRNYFDLKSREFAAEYFGIPSFSDIRIFEKFNT